MIPNQLVAHSKLCLWMVPLVVFVAMTGCNPDQGSKRSNSGDSSSPPTSSTIAVLPRFIPLGTAGSAGVFFIMGNAIAEVLNETKGEATWTVQPNGTKGTQQNILMLDKGEILLGMSNAAISYNAVNGLGIWNQPYQIRTVATMAPNVGLFVTKKNSGIRAFADLKGKRIAVGPAGAGFETFLGPLMTAHGVAYTDSEKGFTPIPADYTTAVQLLGDGDIDAAFVGGATPMSAIIQATSSMDLYYIPFDETVLAELIGEYPFFLPATIPAKNPQGKPTYKGLDHDFKTIDVGSMHVITDARVSDELIYEMAKRIWENREAIAAKHPAGKSINEKNVVRDVGTPFHPGAIKFYKEIGVWTED